MNQAAPTTPTTPTANPSTPPTVTGRLQEKAHDHIILHIPGTDYRLHLLTEAPLTANVGDLITGTIHANARRVDIFPAGGQFVEPVLGRPRRVHGRVIGGNTTNNQLYVQAGPPIILQLTKAQQARNFAIGQLVGCDVERGATFTPA